MDNELTREEVELLGGMLDGAIEQMSGALLSADDRAQADAVVARLVTIRNKLALVGVANG